MRSGFLNVLSLLVGNAGQAGWFVVLGVVLARGRSGAMYRTAGRHIRGAEATSAP